MECQTYRAKTYLCRSLKKFHLRSKLKLEGVISCKIVGWSIITRPYYPN